MIGGPPCPCVICVPPGRKRRRAWKLEITTVRKHGWGVVGILQPEDEPTWAFSYGFWHSFRQPEVAMGGMDRDDMMLWINEVGAILERGGELRAETELTGIIDGYPVLLRAADPSWNDGLFGTAIGFYQQQEPRFLQVVWPDRHGLWPWSDDATERCREWQPQLWTPLGEHPGELWPRIATVP
jgi:hypothetical protein